MIGEPIIWHRHTEGVEDEYGNISPDSYTDEEITAAFAPESTRDADGDRVVSDAKLYLREPIPYLSKDLFTARGVKYFVEGDSAGGWVNPFTSTMFGQEIQLKRVTG